MGASVYQRAISNSFYGGKRISASESNLKKDIIIRIVYWVDLTKTI
jgi:hypothetical protein